MLSRRTLLATTAVGAPALTLPAAPVAAWTPSGDLGAEAAERAQRRGAVVGSFVSAPDLFNGDVGDLSRLPRWDGGANSINASWRRASGQALDALERHRPDAVLVAGDLVEGRWNLDTQGRELFGRVRPFTDPRSLAQCRTAITAAGGVYYGHYRRMFAERGLPLLPALGDHEILDDRTGPGINSRWSPSGHVVRRGGRLGAPDNRWHLVPHAKKTWADHFTRPQGRPRFDHRPRGTQQEWTAYAVDLGPRLTVVTVDVFTRTPAGVRLGVFGEQLAWLRRTVRRAKKQGRVVVVQGHVPIIAPVRSMASGGLRIPEGRDSALYRTLAREDVDLYLCGEVHDTSLRQHHPGAPVQVAHGSIFRYAFNYLHGQVHADGTTVLDYYEMSVERASRERGLWSTDHSKWQRTQVEYGDPVHRGSLVVRDGRVLQRTGKLAPYRPGHDRLAYQGNLHPTWI